MLEKLLSPRLFAPCACTSACESVSVCVSGKVGAVKDDKMQRFAVDWQHFSTWMFQTLTAAAELVTGRGEILTAPGHRLDAPHVTLRLWATHKKTINKERGEKFYLSYVVPSVCPSVFRVLAEELIPSVETSGKTSEWTQNSTILKHEQLKKRAARKEHCNS